MEDIKRYIEKEINENQETTLLEWNVVQNFINAQLNDFKNNDGYSEKHYNFDLEFAINELMLILVGRKNHNYNDFHGLIYNYSHHKFLWEKLIYKTADEGLAYLSLYCLYKCNWLLSKIKFNVNKDDEEENFKILDYDLFDNFIDILNQDHELLNKFAKIKKYVSNLSLSNESKQYYRLIDYLKNRLPESEGNERDESVEDNEGGEFAEGNVGGGSTEGNEDDESEIHIIISNNIKTKEISFLNYIFPTFIEKFCKKFKAKKFKQADKYLQELSRSNTYPEPHFYYRFLIKILRLICNLEMLSDKSEQEKLDFIEQKIVPILVSLWLDVMLPSTEDISAFNNKTFEFGKNHPVLYSKLIEVTLVYFEKGNKDNLTINGINGSLTKEFLRQHLALTMWN